MIWYLDPTHVTDELYQGEEGDVDVRRVVGVGCLGGELHVYVGECFHVPEIRIYVVMYIYIIYFKHFNIEDAHSLVDRSRIQELPAEESGSEVDVD